MIYYYYLLGDLLFFRGLGSHVLVLNSMKAINDLLDKRSSVYSNRPTFTVVGELMGLGQVSSSSAPQSANTSDISFRACRFFRMGKSGARTGDWHIQHSAPQR